MKLIKFKGFFKNLTEYKVMTEHPIRTYLGVTMVDEEGDEVYFHSMSIPVNNDETFGNNDNQTFYIARVKVSDKMIGAVFANDNGNEKYFFEDHAKITLSHMGRISTKRGIIALEVGIKPYGVIATIFSFLATAAVIGLPYMAGLTFIAWLFWPVLIAISVWTMSPFFSAKYSGFAEAKEMLINNGFDLNKAKRGSDKY